MRQCKRCKKPLEITLLGLKDFCSEDCKKAHRAAYQASWLKKKRNVDKKGGYGNMDSQNVDSANAHVKPIYEGKKEGLRHSGDNFSIVHLLETVKGGESIAKRYCPEYTRKEREGYCIRDSMPHEIECSACINAKIRDTNGDSPDFEALFGEIESYGIAK